ncbi:hypothetical protein HOP50_02g15660 [Chloropicon primus]|uniref:UBA domain-containing protein n=2 Tax=Chloropicon primus TaxID=1764295 RepID=A0A5B8MF75_9CHLO|nr:hypothetical protein A3770_02p15750 [Chloropicon primus]UPQ98266.1 hypothetical protein HOP50_02g15660 [Chloropicon primus]|eukprot:QDZ19057.1 hypothetical protein A3770_02p15750 [Chloropicon primus]
MREGERRREVVYRKEAGGGLDGVPVTRALLFASLGLSLVLGQDKVQLPARGFELLCWSTGSEIIVGTLLLYWLKEVERVKGSRKTATMILLASVVQSLARAALSALWPDVFKGGFCDGPLTAVFALIAAFWLTVPSIASLEVFGGLQVTNNVFVYVAALHLIVGRGWKSFSLGAVGWLFGLAYQTNFLSLGRVELPSFLSQACGKVFEGADYDKVKVRYGRFVQIRREPGRGEGGGQNQQGTGLFGGARPAEPHPQALQMLESMGFDTGVASEALRQTNNNLNEAASMLLGQG